jgi:predicted DNA-binding protein YlxM (UPF0122 family)
MKDSTGKSSTGQALFILCDYSHRVADIALDMKISKSTVYGFINDSFTSVKRIIKILDMQIYKENVTRIENNVIKEFSENKF